jgi:serine/threonine protein kinase
MSLSKHSTCTYNSHVDIPGYNIEREIGHGGMATVYLAIQESLGRPVALKVMSQALAADRTFSDRFIKEAKTIALLSHHNIVAIYDVGVADHNHYLALEFVGGGDLKGRIRGGPILAEAAFSVVRDIASALGYAHSKGFVHRDVKPENILFRDNGTAVLTDFGIARAAGTGTRMTGMGMSIGTPHYMSPEQAMGKDVDGRVDIYALGIVLYEMLTGSVPYDAEETLAIGIKHVTEPVPVLSAALSGHQLLLDRMLAKNPEDRFLTAEKLVEAIDAHDPGARPRSSGSRPIPLISTTTGSSKKVMSVRVGGGLKWALVGGVAAIGAFGFAWMVQKDSKATSGGGGTAVMSGVPNPNASALETALINPSGAEKVGPALQAPSAMMIGVVPRSPKPDQVKTEHTAWKVAEENGSASAYKKFLSSYPKGSFASLANARLAKLGEQDGGGGSSSPSMGLSSAEEQRKKSEMMIASILDEGDVCFRLKKFECAIASANAALRIVADDQRAISLKERSYAGQKKALEGVTIQ